jgi:hypothetical protein
LLFPGFAPIRANPKEVRLADACKAAVLPGFIHKNPGMGADRTGRTHEAEIRPD